MKSGKWRLSWDTFETRTKFKTSKFFLEFLSWVQICTKELHFRLFFLWIIYIENKIHFDTEIYTWKFLVVQNSYKFWQFFLALFLSPKYTNTPMTKNTPGGKICQYSQTQKYRTAQNVSIPQSCILLTWHFFSFYYTCLFCLKHYFLYYCCSLFLWCPHSICLNLLFQFFFFWFLVCSKFSFNFALNELNFPYFCYRGGKLGY